MPWHLSLRFLHYYPLLPDLLRVGSKMSFLDKISLRKINSLVALIIILLLLCHALESLLYLTGISPYSPSMQVTGRRLFLWVMLHMIISLYLFLKDKHNNRKFKKYDHIRNDTRRQAISGIAIVILVILHVVTYSISPVNVLNNYMIYIHFIIDNLLFCSLLIHLTISIPRLMVSFGFLTEESSYEKFSHRISVAFKIIFVILLLSEVLYYFL